MIGQIYVDDSATGNNDGSSWANAYTDLQSALSLTSSSEIWVAEGTYQPTLQDTFIYFSFGTAHTVYGGFNGTETQASQRDPDTYVSMIDGDINGDDTVADFEINRADNATHLFYVSEGLPITTIDGFTFSGGSTLYTNDLDDFSWRGGAIYALSPIAVSNCMFQNNAARSGAGIYILGTDGSSVVDCEFSQSYATSQAAGVMLNGASNAIVEDCGFINNTTNRGSLYAFVSNGVEVIDCDFINNGPHPDSWGVSGFNNWNSTNIFMEGCLFQNLTGGNASSIYIDGRDTDEFQMTINDCTFENNTTTSYGGTVYGWRADYEMNDCVFNSNEGPNAAAIYNGNTKAVINNTEFSTNSANFGGATANYNEETDATYTDCTFFNNEGNTSGGACMVGFKGHASFVDCTFESNLAQFGGALYIQNDSTSADFEGCNFLSNDAANNGGAISCFGSIPLDISECTFELNKGDVGGALAIGDDTLYLSSLNVDKCEFLFNEGFNQGGAINVGNSDVTIQSTLFAYNGAFGNGTGGAISNNSSGGLNSTITIINSTITEGIGSLAAGIAQWEDGTADATVTLQNTIMYNTFGSDFATEDGDPEVFSMGGNLVYQADMASVFSGTNDEMGTNPLFTDVGAFDFTLTSASPAVNTGIASGAPTTDLNGDPIQDEVDKGCYEFQGIIESTANLVFATQISLLNNPATELAILQIENEYAGDLMVSIFDMTGKVCYSNTFQKATNLEQYPLLVKNLTAGTYMVRVVSQDGFATKRLIKL